MRPSSVAVAAAVLVSLPGCAGGGSTAESESTGSSPSGELVVADVWIRPTPPVSNVGAFYLTVDNDGERADEVIGATAPRCAEIEIHRTETTDGIASMAEASAAELVVPAGGSLVFEPTGLHVMCLGLDQPVVDGEPLTLTLEFGRAGQVTVEASAENR